MPQVPPHCSCFIKAQFKVEELFAPQFSGRSKGLWGGEYFFIFHTQQSEESLPTPSGILSISQRTWKRASGCQLSLVSSVTMRGKCRCHWLTRAVESGYSLHLLSRDNIWRSFSAPVPKTRMEFHFALLIAFCIACFKLFSYSVPRTAALVLINAWGWRYGWVKRNIKSVSHNKLFDLCSIRRKKGTRSVWQGDSAAIEFLFPVFSLET